MSFLGGPECSTAGNPLSQFTKHVQDDNSLQRERLQGQAPGQIRESFRSPRSSAAEDEMMQQFLQQNGQIPDHPAPDASTMEQMRRDLDGYRMRSSMQIDQSWAHEFDPVSQVQPEPDALPLKPAGFSSPQFSPSDFQRFEAAQRSDTSKSAAFNQSPFSISSFQRPMGMGYGMTMGMGTGMGMGMGAMSMPYRSVNAQARQSNQVQQAKGKGRMVELDDNEWEKQFDEMEQTEKSEALDAHAKQAMEEKLNQMDRSVVPESCMSHFESTWQDIKAETEARRNINSLQESADMGLSGDTWNDINTWDAFDGQFADSLRDPQLGNYTFEEDNPFAGTADPYEEGLKIIREGGNLTLATLAFEAAVQKTPDHVDAWAQLGTAQAQNEKEGPAIRALTQCLKLDDSNLAALMGLAISYTNEGYDSTAYRALERWLSTKYPQIISASDLTPEAEVGFTDRHLLHEKVTDLFIRAAQLSPGGEQMDPDVQVGLGVLFYGAEEYDKAVDCFEAALASTEQGTSNRSDQQHLLWNRLGATLANSGRSEEAIAAYEKALTMYPNFVRARYNLGVSCINIGVYEQAAQHLLGALSMHRVVEQEGMERVKEVVGDGIEEQDVERMVAMNQSTNLLETLRRVFQSMGRRDLAEKVEVGMDVDSFRGDFDF